MPTIPDIRDGRIHTSNESMVAGVIRI